MSPSSLRGAAALALWLLFGAYVIGCGSDHVVRPAAGLQDLGPAPDSPTNALRLLEWIYDNKSIEPYRQLLSSDFRFYCSPTDSSGAQWRGTPWTREDELAFATRLFTGGGAGVPRVTSIQMTLDHNFFILPDPNFPWDATGRWHKNIRSTITLVIDIDDGSSTEIQGHANFFLVRGDSAAIAADLVQQGVRPDSTRWCLRRWDDETSASGEPRMLAAQPSSPYTLCRIKGLYR